MRLASGRRHKWRALSTEAIGIHHVARSRASWMQHEESVELAVRDGFSPSHQSTQLGRCQCDRLQERPWLQSPASLSTTGSLSLSLGSHRNWEGREALGTTSTTVEEGAAPPVLRLGASCHGHKTVSKQQSGRRTDGFFGLLHRRIVSLKRRAGVATLEDAENTLSPRIHIPGMWNMLMSTMLHDQIDAKRREPHRAGERFASLQGAIEAVREGNGGGHVAAKGAGLRKHLVRLARLVMPPADVWLSAGHLDIGDTCQVVVTVPPPNGILEKLYFATWERFRKGNLVRVRYEENDIPIFPIGPDSYRWRAFIPTTPLDSPGKKDIKVEVNDGRHQPFNGSLELKNREYETESIWLSEAKSGLSGSQKEMEAVAALRDRITPLQHWEGDDGFVLPSDGEVTTPYGLRRYYNGVFAKGYYHRGVDYGAPEGDAVKAPASGEVALVGRENEGFDLHGNCVGLDHGHGVTSILMHLSDIAVREGQIVRAGDVVGAIGETGLATGPHLHWGLYVSGKCVDPEPWIEGRMK